MTLILKGTDNSVSSPAVQGGTAGTTTGEYFPNTNQWAVATNGTQAMLVDSSQNVIIGASATDSGAKTRVVFGASQNGVQIKDSNDTSNAAFLIFQNGSNTNFATIQRDGTNNSLSIGTVSAITFPATQVASAGANTLDDYEEGTWTPTFSVGGTTFTSRGWYIKVGVVCHIGFNNLEGVSAISDGATAIVTGLPFNIKQDSGTNNYKFGAGIACIFSDASDGYNNKPLAGRINPANPVGGQASAAKIDFRNISGVATTTADPFSFGGSYITE